MSGINQSFLDRLINIQSKPIEEKKRDIDNSGESSVTLDSVDKLIR